MHRNTLLDLLHEYRPYDSHEQEMYRTLLDFVSTEPRCFERSLQSGHITGSAWIVDCSRNYVLLTHHRKLDRWLQLGGHADGDPDILRVALREAREESGLSMVQPLTLMPYDVDVHLIPSHGQEPSHYHYDVRWLLEADRQAPLILSNESKDLAWVALSEVACLSDERSIMRMVEKLLKRLI